MYRECIESVYVGERKGNQLQRFLVTHPSNTPSELRKGPYRILCTQLHFVSPSSRVRITAGQHYFLRVLQLLHLATPQVRGLRLAA